MFRKLNPDAIARLNDPNQGMNYKSLDYGQRKYAPDTGEAYYTPSRPATLTIYGERAETVMAIIEHCETIAAALSAPQGEVDRLREAAQELLDGLSSTYRARNGREVGIEADDGEKCYIVHSDLVTGLRAALAQPEAGGE